MDIAAALDRLHARCVARPGMHRVVAIVRGLLAVGFFQAGVLKVLGFPFSRQPPGAPIATFFDAIHQTGGWYRFIGVSQVLAAVLLLVPRTAFLGALLYFPIILNIFIITVSLHFQGTPVMTGMMLVGVTSLLLWDYPRLKVLLVATPAPLPPRPHPPGLWVLSLTTALGTEGVMRLGMARPLATGRVPVLGLTLLLAAVAVPLLWRMTRRVEAPT